MKQEPLSNRLKTLAKQYHFYNSRSKALDKMRTHSKGKLYSQIKLITYVEPDESAIVDVSDTKERAALIELISVIFFNWVEKRDLTGNELLRLIKSKYLDESTQKRVISYYMDETRFGKGSVSKKSTGPENG